MRPVRIAVVIIGAMVATSGLPAYGIVGCMHDIDQIADEADVVAIFQVNEVKVTDLAPCPSVSGASFDGPLCGRVAQIQGQTLATLKGSLKSGTAIHVSLPGPLTLSCDDRPEAETFLAGLRGSRVILFLQRDGNAARTLYGPDSLYSEAYQATVRTALDTAALALSVTLDSTSSPRGTVVGISHTIENRAQTPFRGCIGSRHSWVFVSNTKSTVDRSGGTVAPRCEFPLDLAAGGSSTWRREVFVPADAPTGPTTVRAKVQILEPHECDQRPCGHAFLTGNAGPLEVTAALEQAK